MALTRHRSGASRTIPGDALYNARRLGALGLVRLASCVLRAAIGLYKRQLISHGGVRLAVSMTGRLEKPALALLLGPKRNQPDGDASVAPRRGGQP